MHMHGCMHPRYIRKTFIMINAYIVESTYIKFDWLVHDNTLQCMVSIDQQMFAFVYIYICDILHA